MAEVSLRSERSVSREISVGVDGSLLVRNHGCDPFNLLGLELAFAASKRLRSDILQAEEQDGFGFFAVASGAANFLVVGIERIADIVVIDETNVRLINAHAEGVCGDDDFGLARHEAILNIAAFGSLQAAVIEKRRDALLIEKTHDLFGSLPGGNVYDAGLIGPASAMDQSFELLVFCIEAIDAQVNVRAIKAMNETFRAAQAQTLQDFLANFGGGGSGHGENHGMAQPFDVGAELQVIRAEIVTPFADAVGFIHHEKANTGGVECLDGFLLSKLLGGQKDDTCRHLARFFQTPHEFPRRAGWN